MKRNMWAESSWWQRPWSSLLIIVGAWSLMGLAVFHGSFGDELENMTAAWLISQGLVPYRDFFFHHAPGLFLWAAPLYWWSATPWVGFRLLVWGWFIVCSGGSWWLVERRWRFSVGLVWGLIALAAPGWLLTTYLAESFFSYSLVAVLLITASWYVGQRPSGWWVGLSWVVGSWVAVWSTIVAGPVMAWIGLAVLVVAWQRWRSGSRLARVAQSKWWLLAGLAIGLHASLVGYFVLHQSLQVAWWSVVTYNVQYYFPLRLAGNGLWAESGYAASVLGSFIGYVTEVVQRVIEAQLTLGRTLVGLVRNRPDLESLPGLWQVTWQTWFEHTVRLETLSLLGWIGPAGWWVRKKQYWLAGWWLGLGILTRSRDNELFKLAPYLLLTLLVPIGLLHISQRSWRYWVVGGWLLWWWSFFGPAYWAHISKQAPIMPPELIRQAQSVSSSWGPDATPVFNLGGNPAYYLLWQRTPAHRFFYYHPWFHEAPPIRQAVEDFLQTNPDSLVVIESEFDPGSDLEFAAPLVQYVYQHYEAQGSGVYRPRSASPQL